MDEISQGLTKLQTSGDSGECEAGSRAPRYALGSFHGVEFDVVAWGPKDAKVDLSFACMFEHEAAGASLGGGMLSLDQSLDRLLTRMRAGGAFKAQQLETLHLASLPDRLAPRSIMVIGLGNPETLTPALLERATGMAIAEAIRLKAATVAFAPNLLDAGLSDVAGMHIASSMLAGVFHALATATLLAEAGFSETPSIRRWSFDTGLAHIDAAAKEFASAFCTLSTR